MPAAVGLYQGDLLEGWYQDWSLYERERFQFYYLAMQDKLMDWCEYHQDYEAGIEYGSQILRYDPARERTHRKLMRLFALNGDRTWAIHQYRRCASVLEQELGVKASRSTTRLFLLIKGDRYKQMEKVAFDHNAFRLVHGKINHVLEQIKQNEGLLVNLQKQLHNQADGSEG